MKTTKTNRGFVLSEFKDRYGVKCSLQKSSLATEQAIWLGVEEVLVFKNIFEKIGVPTEANPMRISDGISARMHLTQKDIKRLLPILEFFVKYGELPEISKELQEFKRSKK